MRRTACAVVVVIAAAISLLMSGAAGAGISKAVSAERIAAKVVVPNVVGFRMDRATRTLRNRDLRVNEECSGLFGCIVKSRWWVCEQMPRAGRKVNRFSVVVIYAERRGEC